MIIYCYEKNVINDDDILIGILFLLFVPLLVNFV